jgi:hypothetical protein
MGQHDRYGKRLMALACGADFCDFGTSRDVFLCAGQPGRIDGVVADRIAVELESRVSKQGRGALMDLVLHPCPGKFLAMMPVHMSDPEITLRTKRVIERFRLQRVDGAPSSTGFLGAWATAPHA